MHPVKHIDYAVEKTRHGTWRRHSYDSGGVYAEFISDQSLFGLPLLHVTRGICPETGTHRPAKGILAVGKYAAGGIAIGQAAVGFIAIGQFALGLLFGLGQACTGAVAIGQFGLGWFFGLGQFAVGQVVIGQFAAGHYVLAQIGFGEYVWSQQSADPEALAFFRSLPDLLRNWTPD